jgi:hypothetical protein
MGSGGMVGGGQIVGALAYLHGKQIVHRYTPVDMFFDLVCDEIVNPPRVYDGAIVTFTCFFTGI